MKKIILIFIIVIFSLMGCSAATSINKSRDSVKDYMPNKPMIKIFNGEFENEDRVEIVDKIIGNKPQIKFINIGTGGVSIFETKENEIRQVYFKVEGDKFEESYFNKEVNSDSLILKGPVKKGAKQQLIKPYRSLYNIPCFI